MKLSIEKLEIEISDTVALQVASIVEGAMQEAAASETSRMSSLTSLIPLVVTLLSPKDAPLSPSRATMDTFIRGMTKQDPVEPPERGDTKDNE